MTARSVWVVASLVLAQVAAGCLGGGSSAPATLDDGSAARPPPVELEGIDGAIVATAVRVTRADALPARGRLDSCIAAVGAVAQGSVVERVSTSGTSVTFVEPKRRAVHACDAVGARAGGASWCGFAYGRLAEGNLRDPRLDLSCASGGRTLGFLWIQPGADAAYVVVRESGYGEAYSVVGGVPVRVTTGDVDVATSEATAEVSEHARDGRLLRTYTVSTQVAG